MYKEKILIKILDKNDFQNIINIQLLSKVSKEHKYVGLYYKDLLKIIIQFSKPINRKIKEKYSFEVEIFYKHKNNIPDNKIYLTKILEYFIDKYNPTELCIKSYDFKSLEFININKTKAFISNNKKYYRWFNSNYTFYTYCG